MFIGHFAVALAAKPVAPKASLGTLFIASELVDLVWPVFLLAGVERVVIQPGITAFTPLDFIHYPWTHSLLMCAGWALGFSVLYFLFRRNLRTASIVGLVVLSHWFLDLITHRPDLPLVPGSEHKLGFGLWNSVAGTLAVEMALFVAALLFYTTKTRALDRSGSWGLWALVAFLLVSYVGSAFGPPPPSVEAIAWVGIAGGVVLGAWGYWLDRHRAVRA
jgi:membrane-bound metal-dependent hydrolase YbcI (DUF457 family)